MNNPANASRTSRWSLRVLGLGYLAVLLVAPLVLLFYKTFEDGLAAPWKRSPPPTASTR